MGEGGRLRLVLEGKITEDSVKQFDLALRKENRAQILEKLHFMTGTRTKKCKSVMQLRKIAFKKKMRLKFKKDIKHPTDTDMAVEALTAKATARVNIEDELETKCRTRMISNW